MNALEIHKLQQVNKKVIELNYQLVELNKHIKTLSDPAIASSLDKKSLVEYGTSLNKECQNISLELDSYLSELSHFKRVIGSHYTSYSGMVSNLRGNIKNVKRNFIILHVEINEFRNFTSNNLRSDNLRWSSESSDAVGIIVDTTQVTIDLFINFKNFITFIRRALKK